MPTPKLSNEDVAGVYFKHNPMLRGLCDAMLWASVGNDDQPLDATYTRADIAPATLRYLGGLVSDFLALAEQAFPEGLPTHDTGALLFSEQGGHDLFLTCAGHGVGFWDGDWGDDGDTLTELCKATGGTVHPLETVYEGDDGRVYVMGFES